tara:strand:+ start:147 stop:446 length:300 start_codon:yes stop_codon:yes gene_type:complete
MKTFDKKLREIGLAESRIDSIVEASNKMHSAICQLDKGNLALIKKHYPAFVEVAKIFGENDEFSNRVISDFKVDQIVEFHKRLATQGEIDADELFGGDV